jgi:alkanesulfonate monooxygenase SsuD/methylene tetrahydromethanopterin reductase-like flavin-dependent oxidoreductase (luciferase family)
MPSNPSIGITFIPKFPPETLVDYARQAEAAGFDSVWLFEDCFYCGAFTSAATLLAVTRSIRVGIAILPATVRNPLFTAMEITTLARLYPGRFIPGFGHGFEPWMKQIGAYPKSTLKALEETVTAVRSLLSGKETTLQGSHIHLDRVKLLCTPQPVPPLYVGGIREKTLRLAGRIGDGTILCEMSSPAYIRWANQHIAAGAESKQAQNVRCVFVFCKVSPDGAAARSPVRRRIAEVIGHGSPHLFAMGIEEEAIKLVHKYGPEEAARKMPEAWVDELSASGTPDQASGTVQRLVEAGADTVVLTPVESDPAKFQETIHSLMPVLKNHYG